MAKYSQELKLTIVEEYQNGAGGYGYLADKYGILDKWQVRNWVKAFEEFGVDGLKRSRQQKKYSFDFKLHVVELYLSSEVSYQELAFREGINNPAMLVKWVNDFRIAGPDALRPKKKGRKKSLNSTDNTKKTTPNESAFIDVSAERVKQLEDELLKLRIENAYLKELRRLRLEEEALLKKQRESSTASEENSD